MSVIEKVIWSAVATGCGAFAVSGIVSSNITTTETETVEETIIYTTETQYDSELREGVENVVQEGKSGRRKATYEIVKRGGNLFKKSLKNQTIIEEPTPRKVVIGTKKYYICSNGNEYDSLEAKNECEKRIRWEAQRDKSLQECNADPDKFNCWYDEYPGTTLHWNYYTYSAPSSPSYRSGAVCRDGWISSATGRGACSHHGGVSYWF